MKEKAPDTDVSGAFLVHKNGINFRIPATLQTASWSISLRMKHAMIIAFLGISFSGRAQKLSFLPEVGLMATCPRAFDNQANYNYPLSPYAATSLMVGINKHWGIQTGIRIPQNRISVKQGDDLVTGSVTTATPLFLRLPVHGVYTLEFAKGRDFQFYGGPYAGLGIGGKHRRYIRYQPIDDEELTVEERPFKWTRPNGSSQRPDYGMDIGMRFCWQNGIFLNAQYSHSFSPLAVEGIRTHLKIRSVALGLGYRIMPKAKKPALPENEIR